MNERIKELVEHAVTRFDPDMDGEMEPNEIGDWVMVNDVEKFAELIVRECARVCEHRYSNNHKDNSEGAFEAIACSDAILEHFGVEE